MKTMSNTKLGLAAVGVAAAIASIFTAANALPAMARNSGQYYKPILGHELQQDKAEHQPVGLVNQQNHAAEHESVGSLSQQNCE